MKSNKLTLRKDLLLGLGLLLILAGVFEFVGHLRMQSLSRDASYARRVNRCDRLFNAVDRINPIDSATGQVSNDWKAAKDKFLAEVNKLSQVSTLTDSDKVLIQNIRQAWDGYESAFPRRTVASRSVVQHTIDQANRSAEASLHEAIASTDFGIRVAVLLGSVIGVGICLMIASDIRRRLHQVRHQLSTATQRHKVESQPQTSSEEDLKQQAQKLQKAVSELTAFIGHNIESGQSTADASEVSETEKVG